MVSVQQYYLKINSSKIPFRRLRNLLYWATPSLDEKYFENLRERLTQKYSLGKGDIEIFSRPFKNSCLEDNL